MAAQTVTLSEALQAAFEIGCDEAPSDSEYVRGVAELITQLFLPVGSTGVGRDMVIAALTSREW
jgi:hypothetical protein